MYYRRYKLHVLKGAIHENVSLGTLFKAPISVTMIFKEFLVRIVKFILKVSSISKLPKLTRQRRIKLVLLKRIFILATILTLNRNINTYQGLFY